MLSISIIGRLIFTAYILPSVLAQDARWLEPNGSNPDLSETYRNSQSVTFQWKALNTSDALADLWIVAYDPSTNGFGKLVGSSLNISQPHSVHWTINVNAAVIDEDDRFRLAFVPQGVAYYAGLSTEITSPGFIVNKKSQSTDGGTGNTTSSSSTTDPTPTTTSPSAILPTTAISRPTSSQTSTLTTVSLAGGASSSSGLSHGAIAGIAIGSALAVAMFIGLGIWIGMRRRRTDQARKSDDNLTPLGAASSNHGEGLDRHASSRTTVSSPPPPIYEAHGSSEKHPVELPVQSVRNSPRHSHEIEPVPDVRSEKQPVELPAQSVRNSPRASHDMEAAPSVSHQSATSAQLSPRQLNSSNDS